MATLSFATESLTKKCELLPLDKAKSGVWRFFGFPAKDGQFIEKDKKKRTTVYSKLCPKRINYSGTTTNMMVHLQYHHPSEYEAVKGGRTENTAAIKQPERRDGQKSIIEGFQHMQPLPHTTQR